MVNNNKPWTVYCHISQDGKRYFGITSQTLQQRWRNGNGYKKGYFHNAIEKYGWDSFEHIIIAENLSENDAKEMEKSLIKKYKSNNEYYGYNLTSGGDGTVGVSLYDRISKEKAEEINKKKSIAMTGRYITKVICIITGELFDGITEASEKYGINHAHIINVCQGKRITCGKLEDGTKLSWRYWDDVKDFWHDETKRIKYMHLIQNDIKHSHKSKYKKVICITTNEIFASLKDAINKYNVKHIDTVCRHERHYAGILSDGTKLKWMYYDEYIMKTEQEIEDIIQNNTKTYKQIICITTGEIFNGIVGAVDRYNIHKSSISSCCKGRVKSAGKHPETGEKLVWMWYKDYIKLNEKVL